VAVAAFDRFGRSVSHLVAALDLFRHLGVEFISLRESIDTGSPLGQAVFTIIAAIAQLERSLIVERVRAGLGGLGLKERGSVVQPWDSTGTGPGWRSLRPQFAQGRAPPGDLHPNVGPPAGLYRLGSASSWCT